MDSDNHKEGEIPVQCGDVEEHAEKLLYTVNENPPWVLSFLLGFQHYLLMFGSTVGTPYILASVVCFEDDTLVMGQVLQTIFFCCGFITIFQTTFGVRLPIVQGSSFAVLLPVMTFMQNRSKTIPCPVRHTNMTSLNMTQQVTDEEYLVRFRMLQGSFMIGSLFQIGIGFSGLIGYLLRFIGPLTIAPTIALIALPLFRTAGYFCESQWAVAFTVSFFIILFSQALKDVKVPLGCTTMEIFKIFPVIFSIIIGWILCAILTYSGSLSKGSPARVDHRIGMITKSPWFVLPYPGQWGYPSANFACIIGITSGLLASIVESVGDYYACAHIAGAVPPPKHAINRGIGCEGIGVFLCGLWGTGTGSTSYSQNIAAVGITRVGSLRVVQCGGLFMIVLSIFGKIGAFFTTIPNPVVGGVFIVTFGMVASVGLSSLQYVDLSSTRNLLVLGVAIFNGLLVPEWMKTNGTSLDIGNETANEVIRVLLSTNMFIGGLTGCLLDNLLSGSLKERGLLSRDGDDGDKRGRSKVDVASVRHYDPPYLPERIYRSRLCRYIPFMPYYYEDDIPLVQISTKL